MKSFIYLPIEVSRRELCSKTMLAYKLAGQGISTIIFEHTYFDRYGWKYPGIYIGKNFFRTEAPHDKKYYNLIKKKNIHIWHLDEEGGIYTKNQEELENFLEARLDVSQLKDDDRLYCWGESQKKIFQKKNINKIDIKISGSPNFEILKEKYNSAYLDFDYKLTKNLKNFILINTKFVYINPRKNYEAALGSNSGNDNLRFKRVWKNYLQEDSFMISEFINLTDNISKHYKDETIVLRPHPEEDVSIYKFFLKENPNVIVTNEGPVDSWIRLAKVVLQYGCTTAVQADFAKKPVMTFVPKSIKNTDFKMDYFSNKIGQEISNFEDFKFYFDQLDISKDNKEVWIDNISDKDSIEFFSREILSYVEKDKSFFNHSTPMILKTDLIENTKNFIKNMLNKNAHELENFNNISDCFGAASKFFNYKVNTIKINKYCYIVEGKKYE
jgi:surface carbohydrate biosynthesis protein